MNIHYRKADVVVAGGGPAGVTAAIAAAREGAETLLVERYGFLGGMFTGGNMTVLAGMPLIGIGKEIVGKLMEMRYARFCPDDPPNYPILHYEPELAFLTVVYDNEIAKLILAEMAQEAGVKLQLHTFVTGAVTEGNVVKGITVVSKSGPQIIEGNVIIDATADGDIAASSGAPFLKGHPKDPKNTLFAMTKLVRLSNVDWPKVSGYSLKDPGLKNAIRKASENGELTYYKPRTTDMVNYWGHGHPELSRWVTEDGAILWGGTVEGVDGTRVEDLTRAEIEAGKQYLSEISFLKKYVLGFEKARIEASGINIGVRDTRHIIGEYTLTGRDLLEKKTFDDWVAFGHRYSWFTQIPYRCLLPKNVENLLVSGNCISVIPGSTYMGTRLGSYNNLKDIPSMMTTGQAVGIAAAQSVGMEVSPRNLDVGRIQERLEKQGGHLKPEIVEAYVSQKLPSGISLEEHMNRVRRDNIERWKNLGEL